MDKHLLIEINNHAAVLRNVLELYEVT